MLDARWVFLLLVLVFALLTASCSRDSLMKAFASPEDEQVAKHYIELLQAWKFDEIENGLDPSTKSRTADLRQALLDMAARLPAQRSLSVKLVGAQSFTSTSLHRSKLTYEYQYPDQSVLVSIALQNKDGVSTIIGFTVKKLAAPLQNKFSLSAKSPLQYVVLALAVAAPLFSLYALVLCVRTRLRGKKWLWIVAILLGVGALSVNWTTGQWNFQPAYVQLLSASATASPYGPWVISVSVPLGAILFVLRRKELTARVVEETP